MMNIRFTIDYESVGCTFDFRQTYNKFIDLHYSNVYINFYIHNFSLNITNFLIFCLKSPTRLIIFVYRIYALKR